MTLLSLLGNLLFLWIINVETKFKLSQDYKSTLVTNSSDDYIDIPMPAELPVLSGHLDYPTKHLHIPTVSKNPEISLSTKEIPAAMGVAYSDLNEMEDIYSDLGAVEEEVPSLQACKGEYRQNQEYIGGDVMKIPIDQTCHSLCETIEDCKTWTWTAEQECKINTGLSATQSNNGSFSGMKYTCKPTYCIEWVKSGTIHMQGDRWICIDGCNICYCLGIGQVAKTNNKCSKFQAQWSKWGKCSKQCGKGIRKRRCLSSSNQCIGPQIQWCNVHTCKAESFYLVSELNGMVLQIKDGNANQGSTLNIGYKNDSPAQKWKWVDNIIGNLLVSELNDLVIDIKYGNTAKGGTLQMWPRSGALGQEWKWEDNYIISYLNDMVIYIGNNNNPTGSTLQMWPKIGSPAQKWKKVDWNEPDSYNESGKKPESNGCGNMRSNNGNINIGSGNGSGNNEIGLTENEKNEIYQKCYEDYEKDSNFRPKSLSGINSPSEKVDDCCRKGGLEGFCKKMFEKQKDEKWRKVARKENEEDGAEEEAEEYEYYT